MRNYIILNGNNSNTISGLLIQSLPPISKPLMRTAIEEIDGRDGDIVTNLGYSAYDKEVSIGLYGSYDVDEVIKYFSDNSKGQVTFSNEPDKYYNYEIINQIDFERLIRFKTATVTLHCQPFKYPTEETPVEINIQNITNEAEEMDLDNTADAPMEIDLKGNTQQDSTTGKNLIYAKARTNNGITFTYDSATGITSYSGTASNTYAGCNSVSCNLPAGDYVFSIDEAHQDCEIGLGININGTRTTKVIGRGNKKINFTTTGAITSYDIYITSLTTNTQYNGSFKAQLESGSTVTSFEPYTNGASPNPDYPQQIHNVSGDNTIEICGKNLFNKDTTNYVKGYYLNSSGVQTSGANWGVYYIPIKNETAYTISGCNSNGGVNFCWFDKDKTFISNIGTKGNKTNITSPNNAKYIGLSLVWNDSVSGYDGTTIMLEKGSTSSEYEAYTGNSQLISLGVENLFDKDTITNNKRVNSNDGTFGSMTGVSYSDYIDIEGASYVYLNGNTTSQNLTSYLCAFYNSSKTYISGVSTTMQQPFYNGAISVPNNAKYIVFNLLPNDKNDITLTIGNKAQYISTTPIELGAIGEYEDEFFKNTTDSEYYDSTLEQDKWYLKKRINKRVFNGTENWSKQTGYYNCNASLGGIAGQGYSSHYIYGNLGTLNHFTITTNAFRVNDSADTLENFLSWLGLNNVTLYYVLATPENILLNDTLQKQLDDLRNNARSFEGRTHITQNANDKPFILNATAVQKGTDTATVDNDGNIYSKPTLDIEGNGIVAIYLNGNQMFSVDLSNSNECIIDVTNLEAYDPETNELMNRQVTGDYSNFTLPVGENQVKVSGNVTKATITDYTRWL